MSREGNLAKNTLIISLGTFFPKFFTVLITPILTAQLTKAEYGEYDLIVTIVSLLLPVVTLQISSAAFRFLILKRNDKEDCKAIITTIFVFVIITSFVAGLAYCLLLMRRTGWTGLIVAAYFIFDMLLITTQQMLRGIGKNLMYSVSTIVQSIVLLLFVTILTGILKTPNYGLTGVVIALFFSTFIPLVLLLFKGGIISFIDISKFDKKTLKELLAYSWPMVPNNLSIWILNLSDRLIITAVLGIEATAVYAVANKMPTIFSSFQNTFAMAWQENASLAADDSDKEIYFSKMCDGVYRLLTGLMAGLIAFTPVIWKLLIHGDYDEAYFQLPLLYLGIMFSCMSATVGGIYIAHMKTKSVGISTMCAALINLLIDICFVGKIGIWAGSISTMISYLCLWLYRMMGVQKFQKLNFNKKTIISCVSFLIVMAVLNYQKNLICDLANVILCLAVLYLFDRDIIKIFFKTLIRKGKQ
ncbi:MAG: oligosaccharide flippase family protein [Lachnospiraceae bacterium]|nr:oligosaccharide flippase family protein [Lachnospiraceae bacterium]